MDFNNKQHASLRATLTDPTYGGYNVEVAPTGIMHLIDGKICH
jgi:hypothetical protein